MPAIPKPSHTPYAFTEGTFLISEELTPSDDASILSRREKQVLKLIDSGKRSSEIAEILSISKNTVSRHRQEIIGKLQVKNTHEACRIAKSMGLLE